MLLSNKFVAFIIYMIKFRMMLDYILLGKFEHLYFTQQMIKYFVIVEIFVLNTCEKDLNII